MANADAAASSGYWCEGKGGKSAITMVPWVALSILLAVAFEYCICNMDFDCICESKRMHFMDFYCEIYPHLV